MLDHVSLLPIELDYLSDRLVFMLFGHPKSIKMHGTHKIQWYDSVMVKSVKSCENDINKPITFRRSDYEKEVSLRSVQAFYRIRNIIL